jgi:hypothetical protein
MRSSAISLSSQQVADPLNRAVCEESQAPGNRIPKFSLIMSMHLYLLAILFDGAPSFYHAPTIKKSESHRAGTGMVSA